MSCAQPAWQQSKAASGSAQGREAVSLQCLVANVLWLTHMSCFNPLAAISTAAVQVEVARVYVGTFMTSLDMSGFSLSVCTLDDERTAALDADTEVGPEAPRTALFRQHYALQLTSLPAVLACEAFLCDLISFLALS